MSTRLRISVSSDFQLWSFDLNPHVSFIVMQGDDDVLHAGILGQQHPLLGIELHRVELGSELGVIGDRDAADV